MTEAGTGDRNELAAIRRKTVRALLALPPESAPATDLRGALEALERHEADQDLAAGFAAALGDTG